MWIWLVMRCLQLGTLGVSVCGAVLLLHLGFFPPLQALLHSQQVASELSSKLEQQAIELDSLKKAKEDLAGELEAQKFEVSEREGGREGRREGERMRGEKMKAEMREGEAERGRDGGSKGEGRGGKGREGGGKGEDGGRKVE